MGGEVILSLITCFYYRISGRCGWGRRGGNSASNHRANPRKGIVEKEKQEPSGMV